MRWLSLLGFHVRQFVRVPFFIQLMLISTLTTVLVQFLAWRAWHDIPAADAWTRAGVIGLWSTCTAAAGIIGFERFKGTLVHLILSPLGALRTCACVVMSAATFGLAAFPVAWLAWAALSQSVDFDLTTAPRLTAVIVGALTLWAGAAVMSLVIAGLFVLTPNAITYEGLLLTPMFIFSGVLFTTSTPPVWVAAVSTLLPLSWPIDVLFHRAGAFSWTGFLGWLLCLGVWCLIATFSGRLALRRATIIGSLEVV